MTGSALLLLLASLLLLACSSPADDAAQLPPTPAGSAPVGAPVPASNSADSRVEQARRHAVTHFGYGESDVRLLRVEQVVWPDQALGCHRLGQKYDQSPVPGYRVVLGHDGLEHHYHGADGQPPFLCQFLE